MQQGHWRRHRHRQRSFASQPYAGSVSLRSVRMNEAKLLSERTGRSRERTSLWFCFLQSLLFISRGLLFFAASVFLFSNGEAEITVPSTLLQPFSTAPPRNPKSWTTK